ncbi:MAG TPA: MBL fold metallo-hydrolase [Candidatus Coprovivens excrementavium]|nr:MBL fold metallo-hydrolase [Candidatus Coprovivens excrementavium]
MARRNRKNNKISLIILFIAIIGYILTMYSNYLNPSQANETRNQNIVTTDLKVYFFDVGQADSILITNNGHNMLIDAGNNEDGPKLVKYIKEDLGITEFDYLIGTHPHEDHIGGLDEIINNFDIKKIYLPDITTTTKTFEDVLDAISSKELTITIPKIGETFKLGEADFTILYTGTNSSDLNSTSIITKMIFGKYSYLFTGDTTSDIEKTILDQNIDIDVLKVAHHGSKYSSSLEFLEKTTPSYAIISVGKNNSYNHPSSETINNLKKYTNNIYLTSELGTILLTSNGQTIDVSYLDTNTDG